MSRNAVVILERDPGPTLDLAIAAWLDAKHQRTGSRLRRETERGFMQTVMEYARLTGWRCYHTHDSRHSPAGFPDLCLVRPPRLIFAELKSARGRVSLAQRAWIAALAATTDTEVYLWRPTDWEHLVATLR